MEIFSQCIIDWNFHHTGSKCKPYYWSLLAGSDKRIEFCLIFWSACWFLSTRVAFELILNRANFLPFLDYWHSLHAQTSSLILNPWYQFSHCLNDKVSHLDVETPRHDVGFIAMALDQFQQRSTIMDTIENICNKNISFALSHETCFIIQQQKIRKLLAF